MNSPSDASDTKFFYKYTENTRKLQLAIAHICEELLYIPSLGVYTKIYMNNFFTRLLSPGGSQNNGHQTFCL